MIQIVRTPIYERIAGTGGSGGALDSSTPAGALTNLCLCVHWKTHIPDKYHSPRSAGLLTCVPTCSYLSSSMAAENRTRVLAGISLAGNEFKPRQFIPDRLRTVSHMELIGRCVRLSAESACV